MKITKMGYIRIGFVMQVIGFISNTLGNIHENFGWIMFTFGSIILTQGVFDLNKTNRNRREMEDD